MDKDSLKHQGITRSLFFFRNGSDNANGDQMLPKIEQIDLDYVQDELLNTSCKDIAREPILRFGEKPTMNFSHNATVRNVTSSSLFNDINATLQSEAIHKHNLLSYYENLQGSKGQFLNVF